MRAAAALVWLNVALAAAQPSATPLERAWERAVTLNDAFEADRARRILSRGGAIAPADRRFLQDRLPGLVGSGLIGRAPTPEERDEVHGYAPLLAQRADWRITGEACHKYNCFGWSVGDFSWLWADGDDLEAFDRFYRDRGYLPLAGTASPEEADVAVWGIDVYPLHAARRVAGGLWESKMGPSVRILHRIEELQGENYGRLLRLYRHAAIEAVPPRGLADPCADSTR